LNRCDRRSIYWAEMGGRSGACGEGSGGVEFCEIVHGGAAYAAALELRDQVLRVPLGLTIWGEDLEGEVVQFHYGLFRGGETLLACISVVPLACGEARLRQMAVRPEEQGKGLGAWLMGEVEETLAARGLSHLCLHARDSVMGFYEKLGYVAVGEGFSEVGLPHHLMVKGWAP